MRVMVWEGNETRRLFVHANAQGQLDIMMMIWVVDGVRGS